MGPLVSATLGATAVVATYFVGFFGILGIGGAFVETFTRHASERYYRVVDAAFGFWREMDVIPQVIVFTPLVALAASALSCGTLHFLATGLEGSERFWFCFALSLTLTRATYLFWRP